MIIGKIGYLSKQKDEASIRVLSKENFLQEFRFTPSNVLFDIWLDKLICIENDGNKIITFYEFDPKKHSNLLDLQDIQNKSGGINVVHNLDILDFIIDNEIDDKQNRKLIELRSIKKIIDYQPGYPSYYVNILDVYSLIEQYEITYSESGYNKPGDWSRASINIYTILPCNLPDNKLDPYLQKLLPEFNFTLGSSDDCMEYKFKNDILRKLRFEIGSDKLDTIKNLCKELTNSIQSFAGLVYNQQEHALALWHYYSKLKTEIKNEYKLIK